MPDTVVSPHNDSEMKAFLNQNEAVMKENARKLGIKNFLPLDEAVKREATVKSQTNSEGSFSITSDVPGPQPFKAGQYRRPGSAYIMNLDKDGIITVTIASDAIAMGAKNYKEPGFWSRLVLENVVPDSSSFPARASNLKEMMRDAIDLKVLQGCDIITVDWPNPKDIDVNTLRICAELIKEMNVDRLAKGEPPLRLKEGPNLTNVIQQKTSEQKSLLPDWSPEKNKANEPYLHERVYKNKRTWGELLKFWDPGSSLTHFNNIKAEFQQQHDKFYQDNPDYGKTPATHSTQYKGMAQAIEAKGKMKDEDLEKQKKEMIAMTDPKAKDAKINELIDKIEGRLEFVTKADEKLKKDFGDFEGKAKDAPQDKLQSMIGLNSVMRKGSEPLNAALNAEVAELKKQLNNLSGTSTDPAVVARIAAVNGTLNTAGTNRSEISNLCSADKFAKFIQENHPARAPGPTNT